MVAPPPHDELSAVPTGRFWKLLLIMRSPVASWMIAVIGTLIGGWLELDSDRIRKSSKGFWDLLLDQTPGMVDWRTTAFWVLCTLWTALLAARLREDHTAATQRDLLLIRTIHRWPDVTVLHRYVPDYYQRIQDLAGPLVLASPPKTVDDAAKKVRDMLDVIAGLARRFSKATDASYGANVMLLADHSAFGPLRDAVHFVQDLDTMDGAIGLLYLPKDLLLQHQATDAPRRIPAIALPIPKTDTTRNGYSCVIPGAPAALFRVNSVHEDTHTIRAQCNGLSPEVTHQIEEYFKGPEGKDVRSFASFRIGTTQDPIGVLNIDSNRTHVLGTDTSQYLAFYALLEPLLPSLGLCVAEYAALAGPPGQPPSPAPAPAPPPAVPPVPAPAAPAGNG